jgi:hypothetical protein
MSNAVRTRERTVWIAVIAVLATSMVWLAVLAAFAVFGSHAAGAHALIAAPADAPRAFVVARALLRVAAAVASRAWPALPLVALIGMMLAVVFRRDRTMKSEVRHA